jgi:hypothetical protein
LHAVAPHQAPEPAQKPLEQVPEQHWLFWLHGAPFGNNGWQTPFSHRRHGPGQGAHWSPPVPHASAVFPGTQIPPEQQPFGQVSGVQQGAAQKLPAVGHSEPAGAAGTQTAPGAKPWHWASLVQLLGGFWNLPAQMGWSVSEAVQKHGSGKPPPHCTLGSPSWQKSRTIGAPQVQLGSQSNSTHRPFWHT